MALYTWLSTTPRTPLLSTFSAVFDELGLVVLQDASGEQQLYAEESLGRGLPHSSKVNVLVSWTSASRSECQIEVRSSEPMLKKGTRCEQIANALRDVAPVSVSVK